MKTRFFAPLLVLALWSCKKEEKDTAPTQSTPPSTYNFSPANYSGQVTRLEMLHELSAYAKSSYSGSAVSRTALEAMFKNENATWTNTELANSTKNLESKAFSLDVDVIKNWMDSLEVASASNVTGGPGVAGLVTSNSGSKTYCLSANGFDYPQLIEKGIMGAVLYYQATTVYLGDEKMNVDNSISDSVSGTPMQHHWDEAFGYFGAPIDFPNNKDGIVFWGKYSNSVDGILNTNTDMMESFISGRYAINNNDLPTRDQARTWVKNIWEEIAVGVAIHYLNSSKTNFSDHALRNHSLSEAYAFIWSLKFNEDKVISQADIDLILSYFGGNLYNMSSSDINMAKAKLAEVYNFQSLADLL